MQRWTCKKEFKVVVTRTHRNVSLYFVVSRKMYFANSSQAYQGRYVDLYDLNILAYHYEFQVIVKIKF